MKVLGRCSTDSLDIIISNLGVSQGYIRCYGKYTMARVRFGEVPHPVEVSEGPGAVHNYTATHQSICLSEPDVRPSRSYLEFYSGAHELLIRPWHRLTRKL